MVFIFTECLELSSFSQFVFYLVLFCNAANSHNYFDVSFLSQPYVFLNLLQTRIININIYKLRLLFQYNNFFLVKNEIKDSFFGAQRIVHSKRKQNNLLNSKLNQWTNWLKNNYYQYNLSNTEHCTGDTVCIRVCYVYCTSD